MVALSESEAATERSTQLSQRRLRYSTGLELATGRPYHVQRQASSSFKPHQLRCQVSDGPQTDGIDTFVRRCTMRKERKKQKSRQVGQHVRAACFPAFCIAFSDVARLDNEVARARLSCHGMNDPQYQIKSLQSA